MALPTAGTVAFVGKTMATKAAVVGVEESGTEAFKKVVAWPPLPEALRVKFPVERTV